MNILLIGGPQDGTVIPADLDEQGMPADQITSISETAYDILRAATRGVDELPAVEYTGVYEPAGITDAGELAFFFHDPHPGCSKYKVKLPDE